MHSIPKRSNHENFKIHSADNWMAYITVSLVYSILSLIYVIVLGLRAPHSLMVLFLIQITILFKNDLLIPTEHCLVIYQISLYNQDSIQYQ